MVLFIQFSYVVILCLITYESNIEHESEDILKNLVLKVYYKRMSLIFKTIFYFKIVGFAHFFHQ